MLKRSRLRTRSEFEKVRKEGRFWSHSLVILYALPNSLDHCRFGFSVSRRIGGAVVRNRVKRVMREVARAGEQAMVCGWDLVFIARSPISHARFYQVKQAVDVLLRQACLLKATETAVAPDGTAEGKDAGSQPKQVRV